MEDSYYIPASDESPFAVMGEFLACRKCGRKILVEMFINGTIRTRHHRRPVRIALKYEKNSVSSFLTLPASLKSGKRETNNE